MARIAALLTLVLAALGASFALTAPAQADLQTGHHGWRGPIICVDDQTSGHWPVEESTLRLDEAVMMQVVYEPGCAGHEQIVTVVEGWYQDDWTAVTIMGLADQHIESATVKLNLRPERYRAYPHTVIQHEFLHALGLDHTARCDSLVGPVECAIKHDRPTPYDIAEADRLYPWVQTDNGDERLA